MIVSPGKRCCASVVFGALITAAAYAAQEPGTITLAASEQARPAGPVFVTLDKKLDPASAYVLVGPGGEQIPAQPDHQGRLWWWAKPVAAGEAVSYTIKAAPPSAGVRLEQVKDGLIDVSIDGKLFTAFHFAKDDPKPYLYPVLGPTGDPVTRDFPMKEDNPLEVKGKRQDHHHHRSIWTAHGDIRTKATNEPGSNYWNDALQKGDDPERVKRIVRMVSGPVFGQVAADIEWVNDSGRRELSEERTYTFFRTDANTRIIDVRIVLQFTDGDVTFADTKEGGMVALRLAVSMDEIGGGKMCNSEGKVGEQECWGKPADWCDYVGKVNDQVVGVAVFDAPANFRHPTPWHIRGYGLFAANPFGLSQYENGKSQKGAKTWKRGETAEFNYRILIHKGDTAAARVADQYGLFEKPITRR